MDLVKHLERMFDYDDWANREVVTKLRTSKPSSAASNARALRLMNHVVGAELLWLARLENRRSPLAVWPELTLDQCADRVRELAHLWPDYFADLDPDDLATTIAYVNTKGEKFDSAIGDVLTHVVVHSAYHRGQIAADVRASGGEPAYTDYIHCMRQGLA
jgi:uncharacterized damage-inducible protein DinB